jgi:hypothetical protein
LSKENSNQGFKSESYPSSEYRILTQKDFNRVNFHIIENNLSFQAGEKILFVESDSQNGIRSSILERTIRLTANKTESWSVNSE